MEKIDEILVRGITNIISSKEELQKALKSNSKLNVYLGIDPTMTKIHLGHAVPLRKLQALAELGHNVTFLIGDFTALIGDTSDKESERPILSEKEITENFKTYKKQAEKFLDFTKVKLRHNSEWLKKLTFIEIVKLTQNFSVGDFVGRELIKKRLNEGKNVRLDETLYPVMQGYDSYYMDTDIQIGAADQTFNMQAGRILQKKLRGKESFILVNDYLMGTDGRKMSKTWGNAIWIEDAPEEMFGKVMSLKDELIISYFELATSVESEVIEDEKKKLVDGENPINVKKRLAFQIVKELSGEKEAVKAREHFEKTFQKGAPTYDKIAKPDTLARSIAPFTSNASVSEAKRLVIQGSVDVNGTSIKDPTIKVKAGDKIKVGERIFLKVE